MSSLTVPDRNSYTDHQKEQDENHICVAWVVLLEGSSKMLAQASQLSEEVPEHKQSFNEKHTYTMSIHRRELIITSPEIRK